MGCIQLAKNSLADLSASTSTSTSFLILPSFSPDVNVTQLRLGLERERDGSIERWLDSTLD